MVIREIYKILVEIKTELQEIKSILKPRKFIPEDSDRGICKDLKNIKNP